VGVDTPKGGPFGLVSYRLGALPLINHFLDRIGLDAALGRWLPEPDRRFKLTPATAVRLLVVNLLVGRAPLYGLGEWAAPYAPGLLGLTGRDTGWLNDDRASISWWRRRRPRRRCRRVVCRHEPGNAGLYWWASVSGRGPR
jgi:hypothetical protein